MRKQPVEIKPRNVFETNRIKVLQCTGTSTRWMYVLIGEPGATVGAKMVYLERDELDTLIDALCDIRADMPEPPPPICKECGQVKPR